MDSVLIIVLLAIHSIADFFCQTREMGHKKSGSVSWLSYHVVTYSIVFFVLIWVYNMFPIFHDNVDDLLLGEHSKLKIYAYVYLNMGLHFGTDFLTSKLSGYFYKVKKNEYMFWNVIAIDQFIHSATLILTSDILIGVI